MEKQDFKIIHIKEHPFTLNRELNFTPELMSNLKLSLLLVFQYQDVQNAIALHSMARYVLDDDQVLVQSGATVIAQLSDWEEIKGDETKIKESHSVDHLVSYSVAFISGLLFKQLEGTALNSLFLPKIPTEELIHGMKIERV